MRVKYGDPVMARLVNVARPDWSSMWRPRLNGGLKNGPHRTRKRRRRREPTGGGDLVARKKLKEQGSLGTRSVCETSRMEMKTRLSGHHPDRIAIVKVYDDRNPTRIYIVS